MTATTATRGSTGMWRSIQLAERRQDEREQPRHDQDEQDVAEVDDDVGEQPGEHERHGDGAEHQQRVDPAPFGLDEPAEHARSLAPGMVRSWWPGWGMVA